MAEEAEARSKSGAGETLSDGVVSLRRRRPEDIAALIAGRDDERRRFLGPGGSDPRPAYCIETDGELAGWIDYDRDEEHDWLASDEVNVGYELFPPFRGRGLATRSLRLLLHHLAAEGSFAAASLLIDPANAPSLAVARRAGFPPPAALAGQAYCKKALPPLSYSDGIRTIRRQRADDLARHLEAIDKEQMAWLWSHDEREAWREMRPAARRAHQLAHLRHSHDEFGRGPKWRFSLDAGDEPYVAYVDCNLAAPFLPAGEANIAYATHPRFRRRGHAAGAVRLVLAFLAECTGAARAHLVIDAENAASLAVARSLGASPEKERLDEAGRHLLHHLLSLERAL